MTIGDEPPKVLLREPKRPRERQASHPLRGNQVVGEHHAVIAEHRVDLHVLIASQAVQMGQSLADGQHRQRGARSRFDDFEKRRVTQLDAIRHDMNFGHGFAQVVGNGGARRPNQDRSEGHGDKQPLQNCFLTLISSAYESSSFRVRTHEILSL